MAKKELRVLFALECKDCKSQNYRTTKNKENLKEKLILRKFCNKCRKITEHKETDKMD
jgi:large subunit ribosomal protein L33